MSCLKSFGDALVAGMTIFLTANLASTRTTEAPTSSKKFFPNQDATLENEQKQPETGKVGLVQYLLKSRRRLKETLTLSGEQVEAIDHLNHALVAADLVNVQRARDEINNLRKNETVKADRCVESFYKRRGAANKHGDRLMFDHLLGPVQAENLRKFVWATLGVKALFDEEFAARIGMTTEQKQRLSELAEQRIATRRVLDQQLQAIPKEAPEPEGSRAMSLLSNQFSQADNLLLQALTPDQVLLWQSLQKIQLLPASPK